MNQNITPRKDELPVFIQGSGYLLNTPKSVATSYALLFFLGLLGGHWFYLRRTGLGVAYLLTLGFLGVGVVVDAFTLAGKVDAINRRIGAGL